VQCCLIRVYRKAFTRNTRQKMFTYIVNLVRFETVDFLRRESKYNRRLKEGYEVVELKEYHRVALPTGISGFFWDMERLLDRRDRLICHMVIDGYNLVEIANVIERSPSLFNTTRGAFSRISNRLEL
jgi:DNA-directed RNA polymerase specialized sigma24 family protein